MKKFEDFRLQIADCRIGGDVAFDLYQSYGFPLEMTVELAKESGLTVDVTGFEQEMKKHQELSRAGAEQKFKGGLADTSEISTKYHTATHLLLAALNQILGDGIYQKGSNITSERLRFDFNYPEKLSPEQLQKIGDLVNERIKEDLEVNMVEMSKTEALKSVKVSFDPAKYPDVVKIYKIGDFSIELCGGPHVKRTGMLGKFRIIKEEASSAGIRRIKAVLE
jgi:alanyl-tRNA synthetase